MKTIISLNSKISNFQTLSKDFFEKKKRLLLRKNNVQRRIKSIINNNNLLSISEVQSTTNLLFN